jgi:hypothetical protein
VLVGIMGMWLAVLIVSLFAPDMVSGSDQEHLPIAAFTTWLWGVLGTMGFVWAMGRLRRSTDDRSTWIGLSAATLIIWTVAAVAAIGAPQFVTGSDPTRIPIAAFIAPMAAAALTCLVGVVAREFGKGDTQA